MIKISATITKNQDEQMRIQARRRGISASEVLRNALDFWLDYTAQKDRAFIASEKEKEAL